MLPETCCLSTRKQMSIQYNSTPSPRCHFAAAPVLVASREDLKHKQKTLTHNKNLPSTNSSGRVRPMATMSSPSLSAMPSPDPMQQDLSWLTTLSSQPIFESARQSAAPSTMVLRGSDVIVLADGELRIMSLSSLKHTVNSFDGASSSAAKPYKASITSMISLD